MKNTIGVDALKVQFVLPDKEVAVLSDLSVSFASGKVTGIIGESGCGKSVLGMAMLGILPPYAKVSGDFFFEEENYSYRSVEQKKLLGKNLGFVSQNPLESLNPSRKIRSQLYEALSIKYKLKSEIKKEAEKVLRSMGFENPDKIMSSYPYELSGGMQQRALSAISVCCKPKWIIADEPTKGLDKELCDQVVETFTDLRKFGAEGMIVITHDINLAVKLCDEILVMYKGRILERSAQVVDHPKHPYTQALINSMPEHLLEPIPNADFSSEKGCVFAPRCGKRMEKCVLNQPPKIEMEDGIVECFLYE